MILTSKLFKLTKFRKYSQRQLSLRIKIGTREEGKSAQCLCPKLHMTRSLSTVLLKITSLLRKKVRFKNLRFYKKLLLKLLTDRILSPLKTSAVLNDNSKTVLSKLCMKIITQLCNLLPKMKLTSNQKTRLKKMKITQIIQAKENQ